MIADILIDTLIDVGRLFGLFGSMYLLTQLADRFGRWRARSQLLRSRSVGSGIELCPGCRREMDRDPDWHHCARCGIHIGHPWLFAIPESGALCLARQTGGELSTMAGDTGALSEVD